MNRDTVIITIARWTHALLFVGCVVGSVALLFPYLSPQSPPTAFFGEWWIDMAVGSVLVFGVAFLAVAPIKYPGGTNE